MHKHDVRLVRLESEVGSIHRDMATQTGRMDRAAEKLEELAEAVAGLTGTQKTVLWIVGTGIPLIVFLDLWERLAR
jgi:hypothetical protein